MKQSLGRIIGWGMGCVSLLGAAPYEWSVQIAKTSLYRHEGVVVEYRCDFEDAGALYSIDFDPPKGQERYRLERLEALETTEAGRRSNRYRYVLFPEKAGTLTLAFSAVMRQTTQASIENTVIGRDNVEDLEFTDNNVSLPPLRLQVQGHHVMLVGTMVMELEVSAQETRPYEPVHVTLRIRGEGNLDRWQPFRLSLPKVQVFSEPPQSQLTLGTHGFQGEWVQRFALVTSESFTLPAFHLEFFDTEMGVVRTLTTEPQPIEVVAPYTREDLLDVVVEPEGVQEAWPYEKVLIFILGVGVGWLLRRYARWPFFFQRDHATLTAKVKGAASLQELGVVLALDGDPRFEMILREIEEQKLSLAQAKKKSVGLTID